MAKFDGVKGYLLLEIERKPDEITLVFRDNRFMFVSAPGGEIEVVDDGVEGGELDTVNETSDTVEVRFKNGKKLIIKSKSGQLQTDSIPE
jgi:hypothetical protein